MQVFFNLGWPSGIEPELRVPQTLVLTITPWPPCIYPPMVNTVAAPPLYQIYYSLVERVRTKAMKDDLGMRAYL